MRRTPVRRRKSSVIEVKNMKMKDIFKWLEQKCQVHGCMNIRNGEHGWCRLHGVNV